jgi:hypothetical protein
MSEQPPASPAGSAPRRTKRARAARVSAVATGKLRIGDNWNAITIIALS